MMLQDQGPSSISFCAEMPDGAVDISQTDPSPSSLPSSLLPISAGELVGLPPPPAVYDDVVVVAGSVVEALPLSSDYATMNEQPPLLIGTVSHASADDHDSQDSSAASAGDVAVVAGSVVEALPLPNNYATMNEQPPLVIGAVSHASADDHDSEQGVMVVSAVVVEGSATENWNDGAVAVSGTVIATGGDVPTETATESLSATPVDLTATVSEAMRREVSGDAALPENCVVQHQVKSALVVEQASAAASLRLRQATPDEGKEAEERDENEDEDDLLGTGMALSCKSSYL